jgi:Ca2+-binding RTX toxin-like protein
MTYLPGTINADVLTGALGDDIFLVNHSGDRIVEIENGGNDTIEAHITYALPALIENLILAGVKPINGRGNALSNLIKGNSNSNFIDGGAGDDTIIASTGNDAIKGGDGFDTLDYSALISPVTVNLFTGIASLPIGTGSGLFTSIISSIEEVIGGKGNDLLIGSNSADALDGQEGNDILVSGGGNDTLTGGDGIDTIDFSALVISVSVDLSKGTASCQGTIRLKTIENIVGGMSDDSLIGSSSTNILNGGRGNDRFSGLGGGDTFDGADGIDIVDYDWTSTNLTINLGTGEVAYDNTKDILKSIENASGGKGNDYITGSTASNMLSGGDGDDTLDGGLGNDIADYSNVNSGVIVDLASGIARDAKWFDKLVSIESVIGTTKDDMITGDLSSNTLLGGSGNDTLDGGGGKDILSGGMGSDIYIIDSVDDVVTEGLDGGIDTVETSVSFQLRSNLENLKLTGSAAINGTGDQHANMIRGNVNANIINGGIGGINQSGGTDTLTGGEGADSFVFSKKSSAISYAINQGADIITDFSALQGDKIKIDRKGFGIHSSATITLDIQSGSPEISTSLASSFLFVYDSSTGALYWNQNGIRSGAGSGGIIAILENRATLSAGDLILV